MEFLEERHAIGSLLPFFPGGSFLPSFNQNALSEGSCEFDAKSFCVSQPVASENEAAPALSLPAFSDSSMSSAPLQASAPSPRPYFNDVEQMNLAQQGASPIDAGLYTSVEVASLDPFLESDGFSNGNSRGVGSSVLAAPNETYFSENMPDATPMATSGLGASDTSAAMEDLFAGAPVRDSATPPIDGAFASNEPAAPSTAVAHATSAEQETALAASDTVEESTLISTVEIPAASDAQTELIISSGAVSTPVNLASPQIGTLISRVESFPDDLGGWNVDVFDAREQGGSVEVQDGKATMREGDSFATSLKRVQTVPQGAVQFQFSYDSLLFDSTSNGRMKDSFEAALVDSDGYSLVGGWAPGRDAFFNVSEGTSAATSSGVSIDVRGGVTTVTVDLDETAAGRDAAVVFRLANNDGDSASSVRLLSSGFIIFSENTEPVVSASDIAGQEGSPVSLVARFSDENPDDMHVAYVNWGDGSPETELSVTEANGSGMAVGTHVYADNGAYGVSVRVVDQKNGVGRADLTAQIANVAPTVEASADFAAVWDGEQYVLEATVFGSFSDPGFDNPLTGTSETFTAALDWGDGTVETLPLDVVPGSEGTPSTGSFRATRVISSDGLHDLKVSVTDDDGGVGEATVSFVSSIIDVKPAVRDRLNADDLLEDATLLPRGYYPVVIGGTDAFNPSTVDVSSLEFGPGAALEMNQQFVYADADRLGAPKDGVLDAVAHFRTWDALLTDSDEVAWLKGRTVDGTTFIGLGTLTVAALSARIPFAFDESFPRLRGSSTDSETPTKFFVVDNANDQTFRYSADGGANGSFGMPTDVYNVRGIAASADGSTLWTVDAGTKAVSVYSADGSRLGEWTAADVVSPEGVSVWNDDLWIVDATTSQVRYYQGGAIAREGAYSATSTFTLDRANRHASDLVVGESFVWVVDDYRDSAFVYTFDGACVGSWSLDPENANASGVTLDPTGASTDLWVVDRADAVVYRYAFAQEYLDPDSQYSLSASQAYAADSFALAANNRRPEGIADPAPYAADDSETNASTNEITVELTAPRQALTGVPTGTVFTLSGSAASTTTLESGVSYREKITAVYVNGKAVDALDVNGRFFANVSIVGGTNEFNVEVIDRSGRKESRVFTIVGSDAGEMKFDVSDAFQPLYAQTSFNESSHKVYARLAIKNDGQFSASKPFYVGVTNISDARVTLKDYAGIYDGVCYYDYSDLVGDDVFAPTKATGYVDATFYNPSGVSFTYDLVYLTAVNDAPIFDSVPRVDAYAGKTYVYEASAVDGDGDRLVYSLNAAPDGAQIDAKTGVVSWTPSEDQLGNFELEIQVEDGRGGIAIQQFTVTSTVAPTNRPPVITSTPTLSATISSTSPGQKMGDVYPDFILFDDASDVFNATISISLDDLSTGIGSADVIFVIDESASMSGEQRWIADMIFDLDETLTAQGVVDNRYGLVGYREYPRAVSPTGQYTLMTASEFSAAAKTLVTITASVDGYNALHTTLNSYSFRETAVPIVVWISDTDRETITAPSVTISTLRDEFVSKEVLLHGVVAGNFTASGQRSVLGADYRGNAFVPSTDSDSGYIVVEGGSYQGSPDIKRDCLDLVWDEQIQGTAWSLNILRNGGAAARQFSSAFVDYLTKDVIRRVPITISVDPGVQGVVNLSGDQTFKTGDAAATFEVQIDTALAPDYFYVYFDNAETGERLGAIPAFFKGDGLYVYDVDAYDPDYDDLTYTLVESPEGMWIEPSSGLILWSPDYGQHGEHNVKVEVSDGRGGVATQEFIVTVIDDMNTAPMIVTEPVTEITVDDAQPAALEDRVVAVDADGDEIVYTLVEAPAGMTIDSATGVLLWNPTANDVGTHTVSVQASDGRGGVDVQTYALNVKLRGSSSISGYVFDDANQNGVQDEGETFWSGQTVWLDENRNGILDSGERKTTTDANGYYRFDELDSGTYYVRYFSPNHFVQTFPIESEFDPAENLILNYDFEECVGGERDYEAGSTEIPHWVVTSGNVTLHTPSNHQIYGGVYCIDLQGYRSGALSQTISTVPGATYVVQYAIAGNCGGGPVVKRYTISNGSETYYGTFDTTNLTGSNMGWEVRTWSFVADNSETTLTFAGLDNTWYGAVLDDVYVAPANQISAGGHAVVLGPRQSATDRNFGVYQEDNQGSISGWIFDDANKNGEQDSDEGYLANQTVWLDQNQNGRLDYGERQTASDENGYYCFDGLEPGTYYVRYQAPDDYVQTFPLKNDELSSFEPQNWTVEKPNFNGATLVVTTEEDVVDDSDDATSLREALKLAHDGDIIVFDSSLKNKTVTLNGSQLNIAKSVIVDASALYDSENKKPGITIDANKQSRVFEVNDGDDATEIEVALVGLTVTGGNRNEGSGIRTTENLSLFDCLITNNTVSGGIYALVQTTLTINNCEFTDNSSFSGGAVICGDLNVSNSSFKDNTATMRGGAVAFFDVLRNVPPKATFWNCNFEGNVSGYDGGAVAAGYTNTKFYSCQFYDNVVAGSYYDPHGGGAILGVGEQYIVDCVFVGNRVNANSQPWSGGGAIHLNYFDKGFTHIDRCVFKDNGTLGKGGAIYVRGYQKCEVSNSVFINNTANTGGAVHLYSGGTLSATNSTFAYNAANSGSEFYADGSLSLRNSIVVGSGSDLLQGKVSADSVLSSSESIASGTSNYIYNESKPLFNDIANGDYSLAPNSQAIDKGDDYYAVDSNGAAFQYDLAQNRRFSGKSVDLGAYEWINQYEIDGHIVHLASKESATDRNFGAYLQEAPLPTLTIVSVPPATAIVDEVYRYDAKAIDSRGENLTWSILTGPEGMTIHPELGVLVWTPRTADLGATYQVVVSVKNESGLTSAQTFSVDVSTPNRPPVLLENRFPVPAFAESEYVYQILAADPDGDALTYVIDPQFYGQAPEGLTLDRETGVISWTPTVDQIGDHVLAFAVLDERGSYVRASVTLTVAQRRPTTEVDSDPHPVEQNTPPQWLTTSIPAVAYAGASYSATFEAFDPDGDAITYSFDSELGGAAPEGMTIDPATGVISWTPTLEQLGSQPFTVVALDARGAYARATAAITVAEQTVDESDLNEPPEILSEPATYALTSTEYVYAPSIVDPNGDALAVSLVAAPEGMTYDPETGKITWTPSDDLAGETVSVLLKAEDPSGAYATQSWDIAVYVSYVNQPPVLFSDPASYPYSTGLTVVLGNTYEYNLLAVDPDGDSMFCTLETAPSGMLVDQAQGSMPVLTSFDSIGSDGESGTVASLDARVFWTPTANDLGVHPVTVAVSDAAGNVVRQSFEIVVNPYNLPPQVTSSAPVGVYAGDEYVYPVVAFDPEGEPLTFDLINAPAGMTVDTETGLVRWLTTGLDVGDYQFDVLVSDGYNITGVHYNFAVVERTTVDETGNHAPDILSEPGQYGAVGDLYSYDVVAVDSDGDELTYSLESAPQGAAIDARTGALRWTPTANQVGMTNFVVVVSDSHGLSAKQEYNFLVRGANTAPVITSTPRDYAYTRALYSYDVSAYDSDGDAIFYAIEEGPEGATVDANGRFRWTADATVGERTVVISATDSRGNKTTQEWTLSVEAQGPAIQIVADEETYPVGKDFTYYVSLDSRVGIKTATVTMTAVDGSSSNSNTIRRSATMTASVPKGGDYEIRVVATDVDGVTSVATKTITCSGVDPRTPIADVTSPDVEGDEVLIQKVTDIVGDIYDPDGDMEYWTVSIGAYGLEPDQENGWRLLYREDKDPNTDEPLERRSTTLYRFDPSLFADGWYTIRIKGYDARQNSGGVTIDVFVLADSDWANFSFAFTDLNIQTSSIPFVMTRGYDTKLTAQDGEFGYGWTHTFRSLKIQTNVKSPDGESFGMYEPFYYGSSKIMVTLPDGSKDVFNFKLGSGTNAANGTYESQAYNIMGVYSPSFECATDSGATLTLDGSFQFQLSKLRIMDDGACYSWGMQKPYNPFDPEINTGFTYTTKDGVAYHIDSRTMKTDSVTDTCGNKLVFSGDEVFDENGAKVVTFTRDFHDRITSITLADGRSVSYTYDKIGNLSSFTGLDGQTIEYKYYDTVKDKEHYIRSIIDADGNEALKLQYDEFGRVTGLADVSGAGIAVSYDSDNFVRTTTDQLGNTTVETLDEYGNVIKTVTPEGGVTTASYDELGNKLSETTIVYNPDGSVFTELTTSSTYDARGNVSSDVDIYGNVTTYTYDKYGQVASKTVNGITTSTKYDSNTGAPLSDTDRYGNVNLYEVGAKGTISTMTNESGDVLFNNTVNSSGQVTKSESIFGRTEYYSYDSRGNQIEKWSYDGSKKILDRTIYDSADREIGTEHYVDGVLIETTATVYNATGSVASEVDGQGLATEYTYDSRGNETQVRRQQYEGSDKVWYVSQTLYGAASQEIAKTDEYREGTDEPIYGTTTVYNGDGNVVKTVRVRGLAITVDAAGEATLTSEGEVVYTESTTYNNAGWTMSETDKFGLTKSYEYDKFGNVVRTTREVVDENGAVYRMVRESIVDDLGRLYLNTEERPETEKGVGTQYVYDIYGNIVETIALSDVTLNNLVNLSGTANYRSALVSSNVCYSEKTGYNSDGKRASSTDQYGTVTRYEYDSLGRCVKQTEGNVVKTFVYNSVGTVAEQTVQAEGVTSTQRYEYDYANRLIKTTYDDGTTFQSTYDDFGNLTSETNREGQIKRYEYDSANRLTAVVIAVGTNVQARYEYEYDADGNRTVIRDAMGRETRYEYDAQGNVLSRTLPLGFGADGIAGTSDDAKAEAFTERFEYDELGRTLRAVSFEGVVTRYEYDAYGRLTKTVFYASETDEAAGKVDSAYAYKTDVYGRVVETVETDATGAQVRKETVAYADSGRVETVASPEGAVRYEYDAYDRLTRTSSDKGDNVFYAYDALGRLSSVRDAAHGDLTTTYSYDAFGNLAKTAISSGVTTTYEYDSSNRLVKTVNFVDANADGVWNASESRISQFEYAYDALGQKTSSTERFGNGDSQTIRTAWTYDAQNRLVEEVFDSYDDSLDQTLAWSYDLNGNRLTQTRDVGNDGTVDERTAYRYDANDRLIQEAFDYNGDGFFEETIDYSWLKTQQTGKTVSENGTVKSQTTYSYNAFGLTSEVLIVENGATTRVRYEYDAQGVRVASTVEVDADGDGTFEKSTRTEFLNDSNNQTGYSQVLRKTETDNATGKTTTTSYTVGLDQVAQTVVAPDGTESTQIFTYDGHGSVRVLTDLVGSILETYAYDAFGNPLGFDPAVTLTDYLFDGERFDATTGLLYLRAREYDPTIGRFMSLDPFYGDVNDPQSLHKYAFTMNNPVNSIDPTGLFSMGDMNAAMDAIGNMSRLSTNVVKIETQIQNMVDAFQLLKTFGEFLTNPAEFSLDYIIRHYCSDFLQNNPSFDLIGACNKFIDNIPFILISIVQHSPSVSFLRAIANFRYKKGGRLLVMAPTALTKDGSTHQQDKYLNKKIKVKIKNVQHEVGLYLFTGTKKWTGRLLGIGSSSERLKSYPNKVSQFFRMDYHNPHPGEHTGCYDYWEDTPYHFHILQKVNK